MAVVPEAAVPIVSARDVACGVWRVACGVSCKVGGWVLKIVSIELVKGFYEVIKHPHPDPTILAGRI